MKSRLYSAVICYVMALVLLFICIPICKRFSYPKTIGVIVVNDLKKGDQIKREDITLTTIGALNLPENVFASAEEVVGRYAKVDIVKEDLLMQTKISQLPLDGDYPKNILPAGNTSALIRLKMIEGSEYTIPETGDVVKLNLFQDKLRDIPQLQFVRILSVIPTEAEVMDVTISVNDAQKKYIQKESETVFYGSVIVRSNEELAEKLLLEQAEYFSEE